MFALQATATATVARLVWVIYYSYYILRESNIVIAADG
jgi:hypothetical protein